MSNLIRGEFYKLRKSKYFIVMIILAVIVGVLLVILWEKDREMNLGYQGTILNGAYALTDAFCGIMVSDFLFGLFASVFIVEDFKSNIISKSFIYGYKRNKVLLSKIIVFMIFSLFLEMTYIVVLVTYVSLKHGFCEVLNINIILALIRVIVLGIMYNLATISIIIMTAIITKSNFCTIISPLILILAFSVAFPMRQYPYISHWFSYLPYIAGMHAMARFASKVEIVRCIISSSVTLVITIGGSLLYLKYEDIR